MNKSLVEIAFILDRSGSMSSVKEQAIAGFNSFLADQAKEPGEARLTLVLFDDEYLVPVAATPLAHVAPLDHKTYEPRNSTALLDAIGRTIDELGQRLAATPEPERPGQVIVAILTDGQENASSQYKWPDIANRIRHQRETYNWRFLFLGANQDAIATAAQMNIGRADAGTFVANKIHFATSTRALSRKMSALRRAAVDGDGVREFLVLDPDFPRSMRRSAVEAEEAVRAIMALGAGGGTELLREVGMLRSSLEFAVNPTPDEVDRLAEQARVAAMTASDIADAAFFRQSGTIVWSH